MTNNNDIRQIKAGKGINDIPDINISVKKLYPKNMVRTWKCAVDEPPTISGRYWGFVAYQGSLGLSYYQDNVYYDKEENRWTSDNIKKEGGHVTHWTELLDRPK